MSHHELQLVIIARVTSKSLKESRENDFLITLISRRALTQIEYVAHRWKPRFTLHRLSHYLLESVKYWSSSTVLKIVEIAENTKKTYFRLHLTSRIPNV